MQKLSGLYQTVDSRLSVFKRLLRLSGRLDLIMSQVAMRSATNEPKEPETSATVYNDDEEVSDEDAMGFGDDGRHDEEADTRGKRSRKSRSSEEDDFGFSMEEDADEDDEEEDEDDDEGQMEVHDDEEENTESDEDGDDEDDDDE